MLLGNARPGDASAATESTKGGDEGRQHLGGTVHSKGETCPRYPCLHCCLVFVLGTIDTTWCWHMKLVTWNDLFTWDHLRDLATFSMFPPQLPKKRNTPAAWRITEYTDKSQRERRHKIVTDWRRYRRNQILMSRKGTLIFVKFIWYNILDCIFKGHQISYLLHIHIHIILPMFWMSSLTRSYNMYMK